MLRRIFGPKMDKTKGQWKTLRDEGLYDLYSTPNIIRVIKSRRLKLTGRVACKGVNERCVQGFGGKTGGEEATWKTQE
jgi:hypothetical protein